jgi:methyl-accepting chemotaxis protein
MINPINSLVEASENIAMGKLSTKLPEIKSRDETYRLKNAFEKVNNFLKTIVTDLQSSIQVLISSSSSLANSSKVVNASSEEISAITEKNLSKCSRAECKT